MGLRRFARKAIVAATDTPDIITRDRGDLVHFAGV
jgi:hypothetical protein